ncbi:DUF7848 domain-containing protein [Streptomyces sp. NBC_01803]|uniref:DUF7848 domain-containing protein n=1 Tax=Streptomyces sp. NBC_01803 TaxID=2975946 RepID=UPI003FA363C6
MRRGVILRGADWVVAGEPDEEAPVGRCGAICTTCHDASPWENDPKRIGMWALDHTRQHGPAHSLFLTTTQRHWRAYPASTTPATSAPYSHAPRPPRTHARPRTRWPRHAGITAARIAGRAFLALSALCLPSLNAGTRHQRARPTQKTEEPTCPRGVCP